MQEITGKGFQIPAKPPSVPSPAHGKLKSALRNRHGLGGEEGNEDPVLLPAAGDPPKKSPSDLKGARGGGQKSDQLCPALGSARGLEQGGAGGVQPGKQRAHALEHLWVHRGTHGSPPPRRTHTGGYSCSVGGFQRCGHPPKNGEGGGQASSEAKHRGCVRRAGSN